jgi:hypothetical protein
LFDGFSYDGGFVQVTKKDSLQNLGIWYTLPGTDVQAGKECTTKFSNQHSQSLWIVRLCFVYVVDSP